MRACSASVLGVILRCGSSSGPANVGGRDQKPGHQECEATQPRPWVVALSCAYFCCTKRLEEFELSFQEVDMPFFVGHQVFEQVFIDT